MKAYRVFWCFFCGVLGAFGAFGAFVAVTWSLSTVIMLFICGCVAGGVVAMIVLDPKDETRLPRDSRQIVGRSSILAGAGTVGFSGVGAMAGGSTAVLLLSVTAAVRRTRSTTALAGSGTAATSSTLYRGLAGRTLPSARQGPWRRRSRGSSRACHPSHTSPRPP